VVARDASRPGGVETAGRERKGALQRDHFAVATLRAAMRFNKRLKVVERPTPLGNGRASQ